MRRKVTQGRTCILTFFAEIGVEPSAEEIFLVPFGLSVTDHDNFVGCHGDISQKTIALTTKTVDELSNRVDRQKVNRSDFESRYAERQHQLFDFAHWILVSTLNLLT